MALSHVSAIFLLAAAAFVAQDDGCRKLAPCYSAAGVVNAASFKPGAAPSGMLSLFGTDLAWAETYRTGGSGADPGVGGVNVHINGLRALIFYASPKQVNLMVPGILLEGKAILQLVRDGVAGPPVDIRLERYAPALFQSDPETAIALRYPDWKPATREYPAEPGETVTLFLTGLGPLESLPEDFFVTLGPKRISARKDLRILLNGLPVEDRLIEYAGAAPTFIGLYQVNLRLPARMDRDPEIRVWLGDQKSPERVRIRVKGN